MKDFNNITFVRWGNLNPRKHKESRHRNEDSYHVAPCFRGIYAFPQGFVEEFLLWGIKPVSGKINDRCFYLRDDNGDKIKECDFWVYNKDNNDFVIRPQFRKYLKRKCLKKKDISSYYDKEENELYIIYKTNVHKFKYKGLIWHHLKVEDKNIIKTVGSWNLTTFNTYVKSLKRAVYNDKFNSYMMNEKGKRHGNPHGYPSCYSKDHFEVFIEKLK